MDEERGQRGAREGATEQMKPETEAGWSDGRTERRRSESEQRATERSRVRSHGRAES